ncbi:MAG: carboxypeptidase regulatory-like domain-containing protein, partial [Victivallales bacterium]|nr:carboxypeptidase regulatory-like domain-containing protein [Victivallales bacterium]
RDLDVEGEVTCLTIMPHCAGPETAVFELLGLSFESDHELPPLEKQEEPEISLRVVDRAGTGVEGAIVTVDAERLNWSRAAATDALGGFALRAANNPTGKHTIRVAKEGMGTVDMDIQEGNPLPTMVTLFKTTHYTGVVKNEDGDPIAGALVDIRVRPPGAVKGLRPAAALVTTDPTGRWQSPLLPGEISRVSVGLRHPDYFSQRSDANSFAAAAGKALALVMRPHVLLRGVVLAPDGSPVPGAEVVSGKLMVLGGGHTHPMWAETVKTNAEGRFALPEKKPGAYMLLVMSANHAPSVKRLQLAPGMADVTVSLELGKMIRGRVVAPDGTPLAGAWVQAGRWRRSCSISWHATTDAEGRFVWHGAPKDAVTFGFSKSGYMKRLEHPLTASEKEREIVLPPVVRVSGTVTDADTGKPVTTFTAKSTRSFAVGVKTEAKVVVDGRYDVEFDVLGERFQVKVEAPGYAPGLSPTYSSEKLPDRVDFQLQRLPEITGTVRLPNGSPAEGATVFLSDRTGIAIRSPLGKSWARVPPCKTTADGRYRFPKEKENWLLVAVHPSGYAETIAPKHAENPELKLEPWARIEGVYRIGTKLAAGRRIAVSVGRRWEGVTESVEYRTVSHDLDRTTDEEGRFVIERVPPGKVTLAAHAMYRTRWQEDRDLKLDLRPGETREAVIGGTGRSVIGQLATVNGTATRDTWRSVRVRVKTAFEVGMPKPKLPAGWEELSGKEQGKRMRWWKFTRAGRAYRKAEKVYIPFEQEARRKHSETKKTYLVLVSADGSFRAADIPAGNYTLEAVLGAAEGGNTFARAVARLERSFTVPEMPGGRRDKPLDLGTLDLQLPTVTEIAGTVRLPDGKPAEGASVFLVPARVFRVTHPFKEMWSDPPPRKTKGDGRYRFPWDKGAKGDRVNWLLVAIHPSGYAETIPPEHARSPDLKLEAWARVEGIYRVGTGPGADTRIQVEVARRWRGLGGTMGYASVEHALDCRTDDEGRFVVDHLPPGEVTISPCIASGRYSRRGNAQKLVLLSGETRQLAIGGKGRPVIGQLALAKGTTTEDMWRSASVSLQTALEAEMPEPKLPAGWEKLSEKEKMAQFEQWKGTKEGRAYLKAGERYVSLRREAKRKHRAIRKTYVAPVSADGSFRGEDIPAGNYTLWGTLRAAGKPGRRKVIGRLKHNFTVPEMPGGRSAEPLNLGTLEVTLEKGK